MRRGLVTMPACARKSTCARPEELSSAHNLYGVKPLIGLGAYPRRVEIAIGPVLLHTASRFYVEAVARAGGLPVVLPVIEPDDVPELLGAVHGIVLTGGGDVEPSRYGHQPAA